MNSDYLLVPTITRKEGINGKIKQRSEDFIVSEKIDETNTLDPRIGTYKLPGKKGLFLHFVLIKDNIDTSAALDWIANLWKVQRNDLSIAGTKDKRAFTAQRVSLWGVKKKYEEGKLKEINLPKIKTKSPCFRINEIRLGDLWGNAFHISIRDILTDLTQTKIKLEDKISEISDLGHLLNSFGQQRFGTIRPITHLVGEKLILGDIKEALRIYIGKCFESESQEALEARRLYWETDNPQEVLRIIPEQMHIERKMLRELQNHKNHKQAFFSLPLQFQKLFIHAYQSYIFNKYLKIRYEEYSKNLSEPIDGEKVVNNTVSAPLIGSKTELSGQTEEIHSKILKHEEVSIQDFNKPLVMKLGGRGSYRALGMKVYNLKIDEISEDEMNTGKTKAILSFELRKGSYATEVLKEIIR